MNMSQVICLLWVWVKSQFHSEFKLSPESIMNLSLVIGPLWVWVNSRVHYESELSHRSSRSWVTCPLWLWFNSHIHYELSLSHVKCALWAWVNSRVHSESESCHRFSMGLSQAIDPLWVRHISSMIMCQVTGHISSQRATMSPRWVKSPIWVWVESSVYYEWVDSLVQFDTETSHMCTLSLSWVTSPL